MIKKIILTVTMIATFSIFAEAQSQRTHSRNTRSTSYYRYYKKHYNKKDYRNTLVHRRYRRARDEYFFKYKMSKSWYDVRRRSRSTARYYKRR